MKIKISNLDEGVHRLFFEGAVEEIGLGEPFFDDYELDVEIDKSARQVVLDATLRLESNLVCDRCGEEFVRDVEAPFELVFLFGEEPTDDENARALPYDADTIDVSEDLYDYAQLALPLRQLCDEACEGLCPKCGANLNERRCDCRDDAIDPRWSPLLELKKRMENN
jgi:uncharacterized protein